tara:strand:+ start:169 stop:498 length:330 start_codon:yes stop_codon:yes gene_type:complete
MGFDDCIYEADIIEKTLELTKSVRHYYIPDDITEEFLTKSEEEKLYNGYSLTYHMVYPVFFIAGLGMCPKEPSDLVIKFWKQKVRDAVLHAVIKSKMEHDEKLHKALGL